MNKNKRVIIAITGASGVVYGVKVLQILRELPDVETHLIVSPSAQVTIHEETDYTYQEVLDLADEVYKHSNIGASIASGSYPVFGMIVAPCSIKTLSAIANSYSNNLISRSADVQLKEGRPLLLMVRETPLHLGHLRLMSLAAESGAIIMPPVPQFYIRPKSLIDIVKHTAAQAIRRIGLNVPDTFEWKGLSADG